MDYRLANKCPECWAMPDESGQIAHESSCPTLCEPAECDECHGEGTVHRWVGTPRKGKGFAIICPSCKGDGTK